MTCVNIKMSTMESNLKNGFTKVSYKRKGKTKNNANKQLNRVFDIANDSDISDLNLNIRRITEAKNELLTTDMFQSVSALLKEGLARTEYPKIPKIVSLGLGKVSESTISRYQLALLLCLRDLLQAEVEACDPIFNDNDLVLLKHFQISIENKNIEGKYKVNQDTILFYLPHCPKQLMNNLLWSNWGLNLSKCIIIGNSIMKVIEDNSKRDLSKSAMYIDMICPYVLELGIVNSFRLFDIFNDTSVHFFPLDKIKLLSVEFWEENQEPEYLDNDLEFVRKTIENKLIL